VVNPATSDSYFTLRVNKQVGMLSLNVVGLCFRSWRWPY